MKKIISLLLVIFSFFCNAQNVKVTINLLATEGGVHSNIPVSLVDTTTKTKFIGKTDAEGKVTIEVPPNATYDFFASNYTERHLINIPNAPGATMKSTLVYSRNMVAEEKSFEMNDAEKKKWMAGQMVWPIQHGSTDKIHFHQALPLIMQA